METKFKLTADNVNEVINDCIDIEGEITTDIVVMNRFRFNKSKLEENSDKIIEMLYQLPKPFRESSGGGYSFLCACDNINGEQWTGLQINMEKLFALGMGLDKVEHLLPRNLWRALPGGVPYFVIKEDK